MVRETDKACFCRGLFRAGNRLAAEEAKENVGPGDVGGSARTEVGRNLEARGTLPRWLGGIAEWVIGFHGTPPQVARGMAVGVFVAFSPTLGFQMVTAALLATLLHANRAAAVAAVWLSNPFTALPIYVMTYRAGGLLLPGFAAIDARSRLRAIVVNDEGEWLNLAAQFRELCSLGGEVLVPLVVGGLIIGLPLAIVTYILSQLVIDFGHRHIPLHRGHDQNSVPRSLRSKRR